MRWLILSCVLLAVAATGYWAWRQNLAEQGPRYTYDEDIEPLLAAYCYDCHGDGMDKGSIELTEYEHLEDLMGNRRLWEGVYDNLERNLMPPGDEAQPTDEERKKIVGWIERKIFQLDPDNPDPGRVTLRRLNREEYNNTMRDLFGVDLRPADRFPEDDTGYSFDNVERQKALRSYKDYGDTLFELVIDREGRVKKARILRTHVKRHNHEFMLEHANDFRFTKDTEDRYRAFYYPTNYTLELDYREQ